ncbi:MAG: hypothetical protein LRS43_01415 [Desulfurococcales archaeon]|nr:hypothetical protein [Desulfurococcales archaeon]
MLELVTQGLDPKDRAVEYVGTAEELLREARAELGRGNIRQAAEKAWGAAALVVKAYTYWREGKRLASHGELWELSGRLSEELGEWVVIVQPRILLLDEPTSNMDEETSEMVWRVIRDKAREGKATVVAVTHDQ